MLVLRQLAMSFRVSSRRRKENGGCSRGGKRDISHCLVAILLTKKPGYVIHILKSRYGINLEIEIRNSYIETEVRNWHNRWYFIFCYWNIVSVSNYVAFHISVNSPHIVLMAVVHPKLMSTRHGRLIYLLASSLLTHIAPSW